MGNQQRWQTYDLIKLGIAVLIVLIAVLLLFGSERDSTDSASPEQEDSVARIAEVTDLPEKTITPTPSATPDSTPPTISPTITITPTPTPTPTQSPAPTNSPTPTPTVTVTPTITAAPADVPITNEDQDPCSLAIEPRLSVGDIALVRTNLNFRIGPGLDQEIQMVHLPGARLEVIDGPVCLAHLDGAYRWWQVQRLDGTTGWSAEGSLTRLFYFLEPVR